MRLSDPTTYAVMARKLGEARRIINEYWTRKDDPTKPYDRDWAMHVALVELANLLRKGGDDHDGKGV